MGSTVLRVRLEVPGLHCWPDAPGEVAFLRSPHRHMFGIRATVAVQHDNRDAEFFIVRKQVEEALRGVARWNGTVFEFHSLSCEQIAKALLLGMRDYYGDHYIAMAVSEDGENEAEVTA